MNQKQALLNQLNGYLSGSDNVKKVMNSPTIDHHGKMLSYDGSKVYTANNRGRGGRGRGGNRNDRGDRKRGNDNQSNQSGGGGRGGKAKKPVIYTLKALFPYVLFLRITAVNPITNNGVAFTRAVLVIVLRTVF